MQQYAGVLTKAGSPGKAFNFFLVSFVAWWVLLAIFNQFPGIDLAIADSFFTESNCTILTHLQKNCGIFYLDRGSYLSIVRKILYVVPYIAMFFLLGLIARSRFRKGKGWLTDGVRASIAALASFALGCGLIVNEFLKTWSGRPRPRDTLFFGGDMSFVPAGSFAGKCLRNCSFVSGEASSAGWLFCLILLLPPRWRLPVGLPLAAISIAVPAIRVMTGAHYFSDAILGWLLSLVAFAGVVAVMEAHAARSAFPQIKVENNER